MTRKFNMTSVGGENDKLSTRKLNRMARARGFANAKQMYVQVMAAQFRKMIEQQAAHPDKVGALEPAALVPVDAVQEAA